MIRVTVWNEYVHEKTDEKIAEVYPRGIHNAIADFLGEAGFEVRTATLEEPECGLTDEVLANTDVLFWWGHIRHNLVPDEIAEKVAQRVYNGMGLVVLHSGHESKPFKRLMGTPCNLKWREANDSEILWVVDPTHPIVEGISEGDRIVLPREEMYGEHFNIPAPDELVFVSWFTGGEVMRSGCVFKRSHGKIFYFRPGHEAFPTYYNKDVQRVLINATKYVYTPAPVKEHPYGEFVKTPTVEALAAEGKLSY